MAETPHVLILNGPNLNLLGTRETDVYGATTLAEIETSCRKRAEALSLTLDFRQSNSEGQLVDWIQDAKGEAGGKAAGIIINPAAYTHTSVAILDALQAVALPVVEVHLSNIHKRDAFRHHSFVSKVAEGVLCGFGPLGYLLALEAMAHKLTSER